MGAGSLGAELPYAAIDSFLKLGLAQGCSDVHLAVGVPPMLRMNGDLMPIKFRELSDTELESYVMEILSDSQKEHFGSGKGPRFFLCRRRRRSIPCQPVSQGHRVSVPFSDTFRTRCQRSKGLDVPDVIAISATIHQGMVLVTGSTGTGKSTTLAAMIDHLNQTRNLNIISLEDPIEFVHPSKNSQVIQRELGTHLQSFADGVRSAMREDPDVILVGELETPKRSRWR